MSRILILHQYPIVREGIKSALMSQKDSWIFTETDSPSKALELIQNKNFDAIIIGIDLQGRSGLDVLIDLKHIKPELPILMLSIYKEEKYAVRALKNGASGYFHKSGGLKDFAKAVNTVISGKKFITSEAAEQLALMVDHDVSEPLYKELLSREFEVFRMLTSGKNVSEIADILSLSSKTISTYRSRILIKLNMKNNMQLTRYAFENGLVA